jgi:hypothetical protein
VCLFGVDGNRNMIGAVVVVIVLVLVVVVGVD